MIISVDPGGRLSGYVSFSRKSLLEAFVLGDPRSPTTLLTFSIECMSTCLHFFLDGRQDHRDAIS